MPSVAVFAQTVEVKTVVIRLIEEVDVPALEEGQLLEVPISVGQTVAKGDLLGRLDDAAVKLQHDQAQLECSIAGLKAENTERIKLFEEELRVASEDLKRNQTSREKFPNSVSQSEVDHLQLKVATAEEQLTSAKREQAVTRLQHQLAEKAVGFADVKLQRHAIRAPINGMVVDIYKQTGDWLKPGDRLARVIRLDRLRAEGFLDSRDSGPALLGRSAQIYLEGPSQTKLMVPAKIVFVSPEIDAVNRQTRIWAEFARTNPQVEPGLRGRMVIETSRSTAP